MLGMTKYMKEMDQELQSTDVHRTLVDASLEKHVKSLNSGYFATFSYISYVLAEEEGVHRQ